MIISDLNYLEVVAEASSVVGGTTWKKKNQHQPKFVIKLQVPEIIKQQVAQNNVSVLDQQAESAAVAIAGKGDALAASNAENNAVVVQQNKNG